MTAATGWYRALSLAERARLPEASDPAVSDRELSEERTRYWRAQGGLEADELWRVRLELDELDAARFGRLVAEPAAELRRRCRTVPPWMAHLERVYTRPTASPTMPLGPAADLPQAGFLTLISPLMAAAFGRLEQEVETLAAGRGEPPFDPAEISALMVGQLPAKLLFMVSRPLTMELRIASLEERLEGTTPEARFASFLAGLADRATAFRILGRYPVLARSVVLRLEQWRAASLDFLARLREDFPAIVRRFAEGESPGPLVALDTDLSDRHHGGRMVLALRFAAGLRVVYKPRSLTADWRFQELLRWLEERGQEPPLPRLRVLDRGGYGWVEHVARRPCTSRGELARFYRRQGAHLALLYALEANDFHYENLIARGEHPILIDLETLMQPRLPTPAGGADPALDTVLRSGLLPRSARVGGGVDLSGLSATGGQTARFHDLAEPGTDRMRFTMRAAEIEDGENRPTLRSDGAERPGAADGDASSGPWEFRAEILGGFADAYRLLIRHRDELLAADGPLSALAACDIRVLLRPTEVYAQLLIAACHPDAAQDALVRDRLFDKLWLEVPRRPILARVVGAELIDLVEWDVPRFLTRPDSRDLTTSRGEILKGFFPETGLDRVRRRLERLGDDDLARQSYLVREALRAARPLGGSPGDDSGALPSLEEPAPPRRFLAAALAIARRLETLAMHEGQEISWFHLAVRDAHQRQLEPVRPDLYHGLAGIALFLAHAGRECGEVRFTDLARRALRSGCRQLDRSPDRLPGIGAFDGRGGILYALTHLGVLWGEPEWIERAERQVAAIRERLSTDAVFDVIGGAAGALACLSALHRQRPSAAALDAAIACGDHLLSHARRDERGLSWPSPTSDRWPLTGFGHGAAGIAWALASLGRQSGEERFTEAARAALVYERSWFSPAHDNWPDLREDRRQADGGRGYFHAWCHGAPGIGLGRSALLGRLDDPELAREIRAAVRSTREAGFGGSHCLCHGDLGNLDLLFHTAQSLDDGALSEAARCTATAILASLERHGPRCGVGGGGEPPGLMTGLAGIGYGLLRAAAPHRVPSVLLLETPIG